MSRKLVSRAKRFKRRIPCELWLDGTRTSGILLDLSTSGLFVQTSVSPAPGNPLEVRLSVPRTCESLHLKAVVVRARRVPPQLRSLAGGGLGLRILEAPPEYADFVRSLSGISDRPVSDPLVSDPPAAPLIPPAPAPPRYNVRLVSGSRSRTLALACDSAEEAQRRALASVGKGWQVIEVKLC